MKAPNQTIAMWEHHNTNRILGNQLWALAAGGNHSLLEAGKLDMLDKFYIYCFILFCCEYENYLWYSNTSFYCAKIILFTTGWWMGLPMKESYWREVSPYPQPYCSQPWSNIRYALMVVPWANVMQWQRFSAVHHTQTCLQNLETNAQGFWPIFYTLRRPAHSFLHEALMKLKASSTLSVESSGSADEAGLYLGVDSSKEAMSWSTSCHWEFRHSLAVSASTWRPYKQWKSFPQHDIAFFGFLALRVTIQKRYNKRAERSSPPASTRDRFPSSVVGISITGRWQTNRR